MSRSKAILFLMVLAAVSLTLASAPVAAQEKAAAEKPGNVLRVYFTAVKPGAAADYEAGRKRHMEAHKKMGDTWAWYTYQAETGEDAGTYSTVTFNHNWSDFDAWEQKLAEADAADAAKNLDPYVAGGGNSFYIHLPEASAPGAVPGVPPPPLVELIHFDVKIGGDQAFNEAIKKTHEAIQKVKWGENNYHWYVLANGGSGPHYVLAISLKGWASMKGPEPPFPVMLEKALGAAEAKSVMAAFDNTIARQYSEIIRYRADLSYVPGAK